MSPTSASKPSNFRRYSHLCLNGVARGHCFCQWILVCSGVLRGAFHRRAWLLVTSGAYFCKFLCPQIHTDSPDLPFQWDHDMSDNVWVSRRSVSLGCLHRFLPYTHAFTVFCSSLGLLGSSSLFWHHVAIIIPFIISYLLLSLWHRRVRVQRQFRLATGNFLMSACIALNT